MQEVNTYDRCTKKVSIAEFPPCTHTNRTFIMNTIKLTLQEIYLAKVSPQMLDLVVPLGFRL